MLISLFGQVGGTRQTGNRWLNEVCEAFDANSPRHYDHLGKLLTYAAGLEAEAIVWVAEKVREEHRQTLEWLNRHTDAAIRFFAIVVEVMQIDTSAAAVNFKPVVFPNEWQRKARESAEGGSPRGEAYRQYFQVLLDELREKHRFTSARVWLPQN